MQLGNYIPADKVWIPATLHKFETGEEIAGTVAGYYLLVGAGFGTKVNLTFNIFNAETGIYYAEIDTTAFTEGVYIVKVTATIDSKEMNQFHFFTVRQNYAVYS